MHSVTSNAVAEKFNIETQVLYNNSEILMTMRTMSKLAIFTVYSKTSLNKNYSVPSIQFDSDYGFASLLTRNGNAVGEMYFNAPTVIHVTSDGTGAGQVVAFLQ